jgi:hypothetical protein
VELAVMTLPATAQSLDFEFYRTKVEPIFLKKREGHARCVVCHSPSNTAFKLQKLAPGATSWTEEQSRLNFQSASQLVTPGDPGSSRLLMHTLSPDAGGDPFHGGGRQFPSKSDPDWMILAQWVGTAKGTETTSTGLDFQTYRSTIEPVFLKTREGGARCYNCHSVVNTRLRLQKLSPGSTTWTEAQSRQNFAVVSKLVTPGDPQKSRLLLHPLAPEAGGDPIHTGGKFWKTQSDPEWQAMAAWVKSASGGAGTASTAKALDFTFYRTRVEPIFAEKRPSHARCIVCHSGGNTGFRLQELAPGTSTWTEAQSRRNFENASQLVVPGDPSASRLLMHPLSPDDGGDPFHGGGRQFASKNDPAWQTLAQWVNGANATQAARSPAQ